MANSITILPITSFLESRPQPFTGNHFKSDTRYGRGNNVKTLQWKLHNFIGELGLQASISPTPTDTDWFLISLDKNVEMTVDTTGKIKTVTSPVVRYPSATSGVFGFTFTGNLVWVRAYVSNWTAGNIDSIIVSN